MSLFKSSKPSSRDTKNCCCFAESSKLSFLNLSSLDFTGTLSDSGIESTTRGSRISGEKSSSKPVNFMNESLRRKIWSKINYRKHVYCTAPKRSCAAASTFSFAEQFQTLLRLHWGPNQVM